MDVILGDLERALGAGLYYVAIAVALSLPDVCAALESPNGETSAAKYKAWYDKYVACKYPALTSSDCWSLRCGVLHQGRFGHPNSQYGRVLFTVPSAQRNVFHNNILNDALNLDAIIFCRDMIGSTRQWFTAARSDATVKANLPNLVQFRPKGLAPYMVGMPLIA